MALASVLQRMMQWVTGAPVIQLPEVIVATVDSLDPVRTVEPLGIRTAVSLAPIRTVEEL